MTRVRRNQATPMQLVGIRNSAISEKDLEEFWNDPEQERLRGLEKEYEKLKAEMNVTLHQLNLLRGNTEVCGGQMTAASKPKHGSKQAIINQQTHGMRQAKRSAIVKKYLQLKESLAHQETAIHQLHVKVIEVKVMPANQKRANGIVRGIQANMKSRLEEISILKDAIDQIVDKL